MALQKNISLDGGVVASNCYVRIHSVEADKQNEDSDWSLTVLVNVYKDASARNAKETLTRMPPLMASTIRQRLIGNLDEPLVEQCFALQRSRK